MAEQANTTKIHTVYIAIIVILLLAIAGEFYYFHTKTLTRNTAAQEARRGYGGSAMRMAMAPQKPPAESQQQMQQATAGTDTSTTQKTFNITGGNFYFVPNQITVNKGDQVTLVMTNAGGFHNLVIDELGVKTPVVQSGNAVTASFTASKSGSFVYYCSVKGHRQKGMWGTLTVH